MNTNSTLYQKSTKPNRSFLRNGLVFFIFSMVFGLPSMAQINAYASVTAISGTTLTLANLNQTYHTFNNGDQVIIMQMQDNVIGSNTTNTTNFGKITTIGSAGYFEVATIGSVAGLPTSLTISHAVGGTFHFGSSSTVQIISFRKYGSPDYTTTAAITALPWNGQIGGVVAMQVAGTLTVAYPISANGAGFRGGNLSSNYEVSCETTVYASNSTNYAAKGEGIMLNNTGLNTGRNSIGNGGGGGSDDNGGGAGGGNYSAGGDGGFGWTCSMTPAGGFGGQALGTYVSKYRVFMGGGGGGGQQNNSVGSSGGNGGGIVLISANNIATSCAGTLKISADGVNSSNSGNDGAGGAGAGGSIVLSIKNYSVPGSCPLTIEGNGGNGGSVTDPGSHGGGGGGSQGVVIYSSAMPVTNITTTTTSGTGGVNSSSGASSAGSGAGTSNTGVVPNGGGFTLPITITDFSAAIAGMDVLVSWSTATEAGSDHFDVERSTDGTNFTTIGEVRAAGNSNSKSDYSFTDAAPVAGKNIYRLRETDVDGGTVYSQAAVVNMTAVISKTMTIFPNPATDQFTVQFPAAGGVAAAGSESYQLTLVDLAGKTVLAMNSVPVNGQIHVVIGSRLVPGMYLVKVGNKEEQIFGKVLIR